jgi:hypothetical protein
MAVNIFLALGVVLVLTVPSSVSGSPSKHKQGAVPLTPGVLRELAGLRDPAATGAVLGSLGLLTVGDVTMLNTEEKAELRLALVTGGVLLSERAKFRRALDETRRDTEQKTPSSGTSQRVLQEGDGAKGSGASSGLTSDTIAVLLTALLAIAGYLVQNKQAQDANATQNKIARETAKNEHIQARASEQLNRVLQQQQLFVAPFVYVTIAFYESLMASIRELNLAGLIAQWSMKGLPVAGNSDLEIHRNGHNHIEECRAPYFKIPSEDIAMLEADPRKRQRYTELVVHTWQPPLRMLSEIFATQMHLRESIPSNIFDEVMPDVFDISWGAALGSLGELFGHVQTYVRQLESVVSRWERDDFTMLQPVAPCPCWALILTHVHISQAVGKKQTELLGVSTGSGFGSQLVLEQTQAGSEDTT